MKYNVLLPASAAAESSDIRIITSDSKLPDDFQEGVRSNKDMALWWIIILVRSSGGWRNLLPKKTPKKHEGGHLKRHEHQQALKWSWHQCGWEPTDVCLFIYLQEARALTFNFSYTPSPLSPFPSISIHIFPSTH